MGVKNLWDILESCKKTLPLHHLQNKRVCIDLSCWMVQLVRVNRTHCAVKEKVYLRLLFHRLRALLSLNCSVILVTDGAIPAVKISTYRRRLNLLNEVTQDDVDRQKAASLRRNAGSEFSCMIREAKTLGMALGIPCLDGIEEAEAQCAVLNSESLCDGCFTSDSDIFLFGAKTVYRDICLEKGGYVVCYEMNDIEKKLGLGRHSLVALSLLLGSDYSHGVRGFGPESACQIVKSIGEDVILQHIKSDGISFLTSLKSSKKHGQLPDHRGKENFADPRVVATGNKPPLEKDNEVLPVIEAYMKPKCHSADSDTVYRVLAVHHFQHAKLQEICSQFFEWPPEKTDEYILPRIAERELRRFSHLRLSSSQLGAALPLHMMPVKCHISEVLKHRRVQGRECFEVSWEDFHGLKSSIVPAELVESACPEKIAEFEERKAQIKKQNRRKPRTKKSDDTASVANVDSKLQSLLLDIEESQDNARFNKPASNHNSGSPKKSESVVGPAASVDLRLQSPLLDIESESESEVDLTGPTILDEGFKSNINRKTTVYLRPKKSEAVVGPVAGVDSRLQSPLLDIESDSESEVVGPIATVYLRSERPLLAIDSEDNARYKQTSCSGSSVSGRSIEIDLTLSDTFHDEEYEYNTNQKLNLESQSDVPTSMETDVIDLLSPSPVPGKRYVPRCQGGNAEQVSCIDLSDSDMEISPEHTRKARELRVFLASIREEIF